VEIGRPSDAVWHIQHALKTFGASIPPSSLTLNPEPGTRNPEPGTCEPLQREFSGKRDEIARRE
jgi:hypothetical protein